MLPDPSRDSKTLFLLYTATFLFSRYFSRNPFFAALMAAVISTAPFCVVSVFRLAAAAHEDARTH
jgi:hypothetical protein